METGSGANGVHPAREGCENYIREPRPPCRKFLQIKIPDDVLKEFYGVFDLGVALRLTEAVLSFIFALD
jgi:hypothetical protein